MMGDKWGSISAAGYTTLCVSLSSHASRFSASETRLLKGVASYNLMLAGLISTFQGLNENECINTVVRVSNHTN